MDQHPEAIHHLIMSDGVYFQRCVCVNKQNMIYWNEANLNEPQFTIRESQYSLEYQRSVSLIEYFSRMNMAMCLL